MNKKWVKWSCSFAGTTSGSNLIDQCGYQGLGLYVNIVSRLSYLNVDSIPISELVGYLGHGIRRNQVELLIRKNPTLLFMDEYGSVYLAEHSPHVCAGGLAGAPAGASLGAPEPFLLQENKEKEDYHLPKRDFLKEWIDGIPLNSEWTNLALMRVPFRQLVMRHWEETKELFRKHVVLNCTSQSISSVDDAKRYFFYYLTNATSGMALQTSLEKLEKQDGRNPYEFEDPGSNSTCRMCQGVRLPLNAPPRPSYFAMWNENTNEWEN